MKTQLIREEKQKPEINLRFYLRLFWTTFSLSLFTFGGGFVIISLMRKKMVVNLGWIDDEQMLDFVTIAQSSPGRSPSTAP
jgi:chromate transporter